MNRPRAGVLEIFHTEDHSTSPKCADYINNTTLLYHGTKTIHFTTALEYLEHIRQKLALSTFQKALDAGFNNKNK